MANAKQCDICGDFYAATKVDRGLRAYDFRDTDAVVLIHAAADTEEMETCPKCMNKIKTFVLGMRMDSV
jgi:hypothetical protein